MWAVTGGTFRSEDPRGFLAGAEDVFEEAVAALTKALEIRPVLSKDRFARATALGVRLRFDEAAHDLNVVLPQMEANIQGGDDGHGIVRTEMWKVMAQP